jgi:hypothetical protein
MTVLPHQQEKSLVEPDNGITPLSDLATSRPLVRRWALSLRPQINQGFPPSRQCLEQLERTEVLLYKSGRRVVPITLFRRDCRCSTISSETLNSGWLERWRPPDFRPVPRRIVQVRISRLGCNLYTCLASRLTGMYPVEPLLLTLEFRERCENLGAMTTWINTRPDLGNCSVGTD